MIYLYVIYYNINSFINRFKKEIVTKVATWPPRNEKFPEEEETQPLLLIIGFDRNRRRLRMALVAKYWMRLVAGGGGGAAAVPPLFLHRLSAVRPYHPSVYEGTIFPSPPRWFRV